MLIDVIYLIALLCGCAAVWKNSRQSHRLIVFNTAFILLCGAVASSALFALGVPGDPLLYIAIDLAMVIPIICTQRKLGDSLIVALFIPAWPFYIWGDHMMLPVTSLIASLQLFLTFPLPQWAVTLRTRIHNWCRANPHLKMAIA